MCPPSESGGCSLRSCDSSGVWKKSAGKVEKKKEKSFPATHPTLILSTGIWEKKQFTMKVLYIVMRKRSVRSNYLHVISTVNSFKKILPSKMTCVKFLRLHPGVSCRDTLNFKNRTKGDLTTETHVLYVMFLSAPSAPDVSDCIAPCPPSRSRTFRWTVSRTTWRPKRSCCSGPSGWWRDTRACAATTSPPAGGMANSSTPSYTNTGEANVRARN